MIILVLMSLSLLPMVEPVSIKIHYHKGVWIESGLLYKYSMTDIKNMIRYFCFDSVVIMPFPYSGEVDTLIKELLKYRVSPSAKLTVFLVVGSLDYVDWSLVDRYKDYNIVMTIDDAVPSSLDNVKKLKSMGLKVAIVHGYNEEIKDVLKVADYSMVCIYPLYDDIAVTKDDPVKLEEYRKKIAIMKTWVPEDKYYLVWIQAFGRGANNWRFPTRHELEYMLHSVAPMCDGVLFFEPFTGLSERGEYFDGFLTHPEVYDLIRRGW